MQRPCNIIGLEKVGEKMTVTIRKLEHGEHEYLAYAKSMCGKATYFLYFTEHPYGFVLLVLTEPPDSVSSSAAAT